MAHIEQSPHTQIAAMRSLSFRIEDFCGTAARGPARVLRLAGSLARLDEEGSSEGRAMSDERENRPRLPPRWFVQLA
jgi:hypothetical protein